MMKGSLPDSASSPIASGAAFDPGALLGAKSGTSYPVHFVPSHQIHFFRSLHGLPWTSAEARLYRMRDRKSTRLNSSHGYISYAVFCLKKKTCTGSTQP